MLHHFPIKIRHLCIPSSYFPGPSTSIKQRQLQLHSEIRKSRFSCNFRLALANLLCCHVNVKVIAYMTLGIDVSRLFTEMMLAIETRDLVVKKMVYLYLCTYARQKPDLAIMCINTLQRDW